MGGGGGAKEENKPVDQTLNHTVLIKIDRRKKTFENIYQIGENIGNQLFFSFPFIFSTYHIL